MKTNCYLQKNQIKVISFNLIIDEPFDQQGKLDAQTSKSLSQKSANILRRATKGEGG